MRVAIDHLVYAAPDVEAAAAELERTLGVRPSLGGRHEGMGTFNMLAALGTTTYLEVIGPDPDGPAPTAARPFGVDELPEPRLVGWAITTADIETSIARAHERGYDTGPAAAMRRHRPDGVVLAWRLTLNAVAGSPIPFLIDWGDSEHPTRTTPTGLRLVELRIEHPEPEFVQRALDALDVDLTVAIADEPALVATIEGPAGRIELR